MTTTTKEVDYVDEVLTVERETDQITSTFGERYATLSEREKDYFDKMFAKSGVLYVTGAPGLAKSAIARSIANKMGYNYMDIRLSMVDETDVGLYPDKEIVKLQDKTKEEQEEHILKVLNFIVPKWAAKANTHPTIIHFEELNRATLNVRNAALQILLERQIGTEFTFNDNVLMMASGNLGEEDGTEVEEFDAALNNRLIHVSHDFGFEEWKENYAKGKVHPIIINFLTTNPEYFHRRGSDNADQNERAFATPRSWKFLSDYLLTRLSTENAAKRNIPLNDSIEEIRHRHLVQEDYTVNEVKDILTKSAFNYIGTNSNHLTRYLEESVQISVQDIINNFPKMKDKIDQVHRDKKYELMSNIYSMDLSKFKKKQVDNLMGFLRYLDAEHRVGFLKDLLDELSEEQLNKEPYKTIMKTFQDELDNMEEKSE